MVSFHRFIRRYETYSGQRVNAAKSSFILSDKAPSSLRHAIRAVTGFQSQVACLTYLDILIKKGRYLCSDFSFLLDRVQDKLAGWKSKFLSQAGRAVLIDSVLYSLPVYLASACFIPKKVVAFINKLCANFF